LIRGRAPGRLLLIIYHYVISPRLIVMQLRVILLLLCGLLNYHARFVDLVDFHKVLVALKYDFLYLHLLRVFAVA
jgi:hypothetical protein